MSLKSFYEKAITGRQPFLDRARAYSRITVPSAMPAHSESKSQDQPEPYQADGARAVKNLVAKLLLALFPINTKFAQLVIDIGQLDQDISFKMTQIEEELARIEDQLLTEFETSSRLRRKLFQVLEQLVVVGDTLLHFPTGEQTPRFFKLDSYVIKRDPRGNLLNLVIREKISRLAVPAGIREHIPEKEGEGDDDSIELFTGVMRMPDGKWLERQQVADMDIRPPTIHDEGALPYLALRWNAIDGEDYGRGHVEDYMGALRSDEGLSKAIHDGSIAASKLLMLVDPDGLTRINQLKAAPNGGYVPGRTKDVEALKIDKFADFSVASNEVQRQIRIIERAFLLNSSVQRDAERVTAEEIRTLVQELEDTLGGVFTVLADDLQLPVVQLLMAKMQNEGKLERLPEFVKVKIVTGLDAIGRGHDLQRLDNFVSGAAAALGDPAAVLGHINIRVYLQQRATALGIPTAELIKSPEQLEQEQQQQLVQQAVQAVGSDVVRQFPQEARDAFEQTVASQNAGVGPRLAFQDGEAA